MAYDQGYYQQPQRPYNGPAAQRPRPPQGYQQPPPQQYPPQGYEQYPQEYGYEGYDQGYVQDYNGGGGYDMNGGMNGGRGYPPQNQNYPPQQEYYGEPRGGGGMPPPNRGRGGPPGPGGPLRPPTADGVRGGYDQRGGGRGGYGAPMGRGGRPVPLERSASSDPGCKLNPLLSLLMLTFYSARPTWRTKTFEVSTLVPRTSCLG